MGATGYTGRLIVSELCKKEICFTAAGRDKVKLKELKSININLISTREFCFEDVDFISFLDKYDLIVNCVGPFNFYAPKIIDACVHLGKTYFDLTGEQAIVAQSLRERHVQAKENQARIVHSIAFESTLADILLSIGLEKLKSEPFKSYNTYYKLGSKLMSPGTRISMKVAGAYSKFIVYEGKLITKEPFDRREHDSIEPYVAQFVGYPEVIFSYHRIQPSFCSSNFLVEKDDNLNYLGGALPVKEITVEEQISLHSKRKISGPTSEDRKNQWFELHSYLKTDNQCFYQKIEGTDMYGITASLMALAVEQLVKSMENGIAFSTGFLTPAEFLGQSGIDWIKSNSFCSISKAEQTELKG